MTIPSSQNCAIVLFLFINIMMQVGGVIFGGLSDRFGRKWIMLFCLYRYPIHPASNTLISAFQTVLISSSFLFSQCAIGIGLHFVHSLMLFIGLRFLIQESISDKICNLAFDGFFYCESYCEMKSKCVQVYTGNLHSRPAVRHL